MTNIVSKKALAGLALGSLLIIGAGCGAKTSVTADVTTGTTGAPQATAPKPARQLEIEMKAVGSSGVSGKAVLIEENDKTKVMLNLTGTVAGAKHPSHIHLGACPSPAAVKWALPDVVEGKASATIDAKFDDVMASLPLAVNVHQSSTDLTSYLACGDLLLAKVMAKQPNVESMMAVSAGADAEVPGINVNANANLNVNVAVAAPREVKILAKQFSFTPAEVRVKMGEKVRLVVTSDDVSHGFSIPTFNVNLTLEPGKTATAEFVADKKGTFPFFCSVFCGSGHGGMRGSLIVE